MSLGIRLTLWGCMLPVLLIFYITMRNETKFKKNIVVGVTLPYAARADEEITARLALYKRELGTVSLALALAALPCMAVKNSSRAMFLWGFWLLLMLILPHVPYVRCNRDLHAIKRQRGWKSVQSGTLRIDTAAIPNDKPLSPWAFAPALLLSLLPVLREPKFWMVDIMFSLCIVGCWAGYRWLYRNRSETVDGNADLTRTLSRIRRQSWGRVWLLCAYFMAATALAMTLLPTQSALSMGLLVLMSAAVIVESMRTEFRMRHLQEKLTADSGKGWYVDEDDKWIWGMFYYNPNDSRFTVNARVGVNATVNLAHPAGKVTMALVALLVLALPFMGFAMDSGGKDMELSYENGTLTAVHGKREYTVDNIESAELLYELPDGLTRVMGTGLPDLLKGDFRAKGMSHLNVCLDPTCPPFILVESEGVYCLFGTRDAAQTENIYKEIR